MMHTGLLMISKTGCVTLLMPTLSKPSDSADDIAATETIILLRQNKKYTHTFDFIHCHSFGVQDWLHALF